MLVSLSSLYGFTNNVYKAIIINEGSVVKIRPYLSSHIVDKTKTISYPLHCQFETLCILDALCQRPFAQSKIPRESSQTAFYEDVESNSGQLQEVSK